MGLSPVKMPQLGESVTEGTVDHWLKSEGDWVERDEPLVQVVTDKVNAEIPSPVAGRLTKIEIQEGTTVPVGSDLALIETATATAATPGRQPQAPGSSHLDAGLSRTTPSIIPATSAGTGSQSPAVRKLARENGLDLDQIAGSGSGGRVTRNDVVAHLKSLAAPTTSPIPPEPPDGGTELVKLSPMRRAIGEHMSRSLATSPHAWTMQEIDVTLLTSFREASKAAFQARHLVPLTYPALIASIVVEALGRFPYLNSRWTDEGILLHRYVNLGIAVSVPQGLVVPVLKQAQNASLVELSIAMTELVNRARENRLGPSDISGGTFTLNNTGPTGSVASQPIISQPQAAILTMESIVPRAVVIGNEVVIRRMMNMCLSFDHRIIDGMLAGQFLADVKRRAEAWSPSSAEY